jgi:hypothetical protein
LAFAGALLARCFGPLLTAASTARSNRSQPSGRVSNSPFRAVFVGVFALLDDDAMPNPLSTVKPGATVELNTNALKERPELSQLIAVAVGKWAHVEHLLALLMIRILGANHRPSIAMFTTLTSSNLQMVALKAAGQAGLRDDDLDHFSASVRVAESAGKQRHKLAHWIWGQSPDLPNALLLADPAHLFENELTMERINSLGGFFAMAKLIPFPREETSLAEIYRSYAYDETAIFVYRKSDLERIVRDLEEAIFCLFNVNLYLDPYWSERRDELSRQLSSKRLFREALFRIREDRQKNQTTPSE